MKGAGNASRPRAALRVLLAGVAGVLAASLSPADASAQEPAPRPGEERAPGGASVSNQDPAGPEGVARDEKETFVEEFLAKANELIVDRNYDVKSTDRYVVKTDDPRVLVGEVSALLESFRIFFDGFWSPRTELLPYEDRSTVLLFYSRYKYKQLLTDAERPDDSFAAGHYRPFFGVVALHTDTVGPGDLPDLLVHEAAHQLVHRRLYGKERMPSPWVAEGLATYFGYMRRNSSGEFLPGRIGGKGVSLLEDAGRKRARVGRERFDAFRKTLKEASQGFLDEIIYTGDPEIFYGSGADVRYAASWLLVHFLLHAAEGAHAAAFTEYLTLEAEGRGGPEAFYEQIGIGPLALEGAFREYVKRLKAR